MKLSILMLLTITVITAGALPAPSANPNQSGLSQIAKNGVNLENAYNIPGLHHSEEIPVNFPLPIYKSNVTLTSFVNSTRGAVTAAATVMTKDPPETVYRWYQSQCNSAGWHIAVPASLPPGVKAPPVLMLKARKDTQEATVMVMAVKSSGQTRVSVGWNKTFRQ